MQAMAVLRERCVAGACKHCFFLVAHRARCTVVSQCTRVDTQACACYHRCFFTAIQRTALQNLYSAATRGDILSMLVSIYGSKERLVKVCCTTLVTLYC
jgi:hypothetical protein